MFLTGVLNSESGFSSMILFLLRLFDFIRVIMLSTSIWLFNAALVVEILFNFNTFERSVLF